MTFEQKYELALKAYNNSYAKYSPFFSTTTAPT